MANPHLILNIEESSMRTWRDDSSQSKLFFHFNLVEVIDTQAYEDNPIQLYSGQKFTSGISNGITLKIEFYETAPSSSWKELYSKIGDAVSL